MLLRNNILILFSVMAILLFPQFFYGSENKIYYVTHNNVRLRIGPGISFKSQGYLKIYTCLSRVKNKSKTREKIGSYNEYWYYVVQIGLYPGNGFKGWVYGAYIRKIKSFQALEKLKNFYIKGLSSVRLKAFYRLLMRFWWNTEHGESGTDFFSEYQFRCKTFRQDSVTYKIDSMMKKSNYYILNGSVIFNFYLEKVPYRKKTFIIRGNPSGKFIYINEVKYYRRKKKVNNCNYHK